MIHVTPDSKVSRIQDLSSGVCIEPLEEFHAGAEFGAVPTAAAATEDQEDRLRLGFINFFGAQNRLYKPRGVAFMKLCWKTSSNLAWLRILHSTIEGKRVICASSSFKKSSCISAAGS